MGWLSAGLHRSRKWNSPEKRPQRCLAAWEGGSTFLARRRVKVMNNIKLIYDLKKKNLTCDPELFPFFDVFPPSEPDDSFFESVEKEQREYFCSSVFTCGLVSSSKSPGEGKKKRRKKSSGAEKKKDANADRA